jgi:hypothetical protein
MRYRQNKMANQSPAPSRRHPPSRIRRKHSRWKFHFWHIRPRLMARTRQNKVASASKQNGLLRCFGAENKKFRA